MHPREETEVSIAEQLLVAGCERQLLEVNILAIGVERLGMESALLCGCDNALQALNCIRRALQDATEVHIKDTELGTNQ